MGPTLVTAVAVAGAEVDAEAMLLMLHVRWVARLRRDACMGSGVLAA